MKSYESTLRAKKPRKMIYSVHCPSFGFIGCFSAGMVMEKEGDFISIFR